MVGTTISVQYLWQVDLCGRDYDVELGRFPTGTYSVNVQDSVSAQFTVGPRPPATDRQLTSRPMVNYSGLWWSPSESGWGLSIAQGATNKLFAVWFVYGPSGEPVWYTLQPGEWTGNTSYSGPIYKTTGSDLASAFDPSSVTETLVGTGYLSFRYGNSGDLSYILNGVRVNKSIERMAIE
jgi:hypothetical protein